jgi:YVTN family beta-propeller protein
LRLDPVSGLPVATVPLGVEAYGLGVGAAGVWVSDFVHDSIVHIDPVSGAVLATITGMPGGPSGIAVGSDAVWVACARANSIVRIDPRTNRVVAELSLPKSPLPVTIAFGSVWVRSEEGDILTRIDPATNSVVATIPVGPAEGLDGLDQFGVDDTGLWLSGLRIAHVSAAGNVQDRVLGYDAEALDYAGGRLWAVGILGALSRLRVN